MSSMTFLVVTFLLLLLVTILSFVGIFVTSPVMAIFVVVFGGCAGLVAFEIRNQL